MFVPDYEMAVARAMYAGCDVWLNNPIRPHEACGTSGEKAALNGGLNCSILDGWWDEMARRPERLGHPRQLGPTTPRISDQAEAGSIYDSRVPRSSATFLR